MKDDGHPLKSLDGALNYLTEVFEASTTLHKDNIRTAAEALASDDEEAFKHHALLLRGSADALRDTVFQHSALILLASLIDAIEKKPGIVEGVFAGGPEGRAH